MFETIRVMTRSTSIWFDLAVSVNNKISLPISFDNLNIGRIICGVLSFRVITVKYDLTFYPYRNFLVGSHWQGVWKDNRMFCTRTSRLKVRLDYTETVYYHAICKYSNRNSIVHKRRPGQKFTMQMIDIAIV